MPSVLFVLSASDHWTLKDGTRHETGFWAEEFVVPHDVFADAGWDVAVATPGGVAPTVDQTSLGLMGGAPAVGAVVGARVLEVGAAAAARRVSNGMPLVAPGRGGVRSLRQRHVDGRWGGGV